MKKFVAMVLVSMMLIGVVSIASATTSFGISVWCNSTTNYTNAPDSEWKVRGTHAAIYVNHHDNVNTEEYTNHFRGQYVSGNYRETKGSKWCTQGMTVPIENSHIEWDNAYSVSARGNTNYYNYDGIERIVLSGSFDPNR